MKIFGAALDALPHEEKVALKNACVRAVLEGRVERDDPADPYDALRPVLIEKGIAKETDFSGKLHINPVFTPKPEPDLKAPGIERINTRTYLEFMDGGGCRAVSNDLGMFLNDNILSDLPAVMLGVDHSLTGGAIMALSEHVGAENLCVVVFDGHLDAISAAARQAAFETIFGESKTRKLRKTASESYTCETFLKYLLDEKRVLPQNLVILGTYDYPAGEMTSEKPDGMQKYIDEYKSFESAGVKILPRDGIRRNPEQLDAALDKIDAEYIYVSLDLDVAASAENPAIRFHDSVGLSPEELYKTAELIAGHINRGGFTLAGVDVMEMDVHLVDIQPPGGAENRTLEIAARFLETIL